MSQLALYTGKMIAKSILMVLLVIVAIETLAALIDGVGDLENDFNFTELLIYLLLTMPARLYENIPMASLIGCLIGLGAMASQSELVVMRSTGVSLIRIVSFVLYPVFGLILVGGIIGELVVPFSEQLAESRRTLLRSDMNVQTLDQGLWNKEGNEFTHFSAVYPGGLLYGVSRYHFDSQQHLQQASFSERVVFQGDHWIEENGRVTTFLSDRTVVSGFETRKWDSALTPELLQLIVLPPESLGIKSLYRYANYLDNQNRDSSRHKLSYWGKVLQPFTIAALVLMAISFVFGPLREVTMGFRVFVGVVVGVVFNTFQEMMGPASIVFGFSPLIAILLPAALLFVLGLLLLKRAG